MQGIGLHFGERWFFENRAILKENKSLKAYLLAENQHFENWLILEEKERLMK